MSTPTPSPWTRALGPALLALGTFAVFSLVHSLSFQPLAARYRAQLTEAGAVGASIDPRLAVSPVPPRVQELLRLNSVTSPEADRLMASGQLATDLVRDVSELADGIGLDIVESEPGLVTRSGGTLEVRAQLRLRARYTQIVELLDRFAQQRALVRIERLMVSPGEGETVDVELHVASVLLKRGATTP